MRETFRVKWTLDDSAVMGVGIYSNNILAVSYFGGAPAVVAYKVDVDGTKLVGEWTMGGIEGRLHRNPHQNLLRGAVSRSTSPPGAGPTGT